MKWNEIKKIIEKTYCRQRERGRRRERESGENAKWDGTVIWRRNRPHAAGEWRTNRRKRTSIDARPEWRWFFQLYFNHFLSFSRFLNFSLSNGYTVSAELFNSCSFFLCVVWWRLCGRRGRQSTVKWERKFFCFLFNFFYFEKTNNSPRPRCFYAFCVNNATPTRHRLAAKIGTEDVHMERDLDY